MLSLKTGVVLHPIAFILAIVAQTYDHFTLACVVTSGRDGKHATNSLHYKDQALDFRTKHVPRARLNDLVSAIREALGPEFDVILESRGKENEHLHVEHDPKG
jgi:hypothetical protein